MVAKCLNPKCSTDFGTCTRASYFASGTSKLRDEHMTNGHHSEVEYVWICHACSLVFEPIREASSEIGVKPLMRAATETDAAGGGK